MELLRDRIAAVNTAMEKYPDKKGAIYDLYQLMEQEIIDGESAESEFEKFQDSLKELTNND